MLLESKRNKMEQKQPIKLRTRLMRGGSKSIYLDYYHRGQRKYEYLRLYLVPERNKSDRDKNKATWQLAEAVRAKRMLDLRNNQFGFSGTSNVLLIPYTEAYIEDHSKICVSVDCYHAMLRLLKMFVGRAKVRMQDVDQQFIDDFCAYVASSRCSNGVDGKTIHPNSVRLYMSKLTAVLRNAKRKRLLADVPRASNLPSSIASSRMYLTIEELKKAAATHNGDRRGRIPFLFSCLTGLRHSDVARIKWGDLHANGQFSRLIFRQKKTKAIEYLDLSPQAVKLLGDRQADDQLVFPSPTPVAQWRDASLGGCTSWGLQKKLHITHHATRMP